MSLNDSIRIAASTFAEAAISGQAARSSTIFPAV
jgi:hypothetical protein